MNSNNGKWQEIFIKNNKGILNNLLKTLLDKRISRLEKRNKNESKNFMELSNTSQNLISTLETITNKVRKQIYLNRQKLINNGNKLTKKFKITNNGDNMKSNQKQNNVNKLQKLDKRKTKSFDKYQPLQTKVTNEAKNITIKTNSNYNLNLKTKNNNFIKTERILESNNRRTLSPFITATEREDMRSKIYNKNLNKNKKTPIRSKKEEKNIAIVKEKEKDNKNNKNKKINNSNKKNNKENNQIKKDSQEKDRQNINVINQFESLDNYADNEILKNNEMLNSKIYNEKKEQKDNFLTKLSQQLKQQDTIKIDDKLVKDSLLVSNNEEGEKKINLDDIIKGPTFEEVIIDENIFKDNNDKNKEEDKNNKKSLLNSSLAIYNKLKRCKVTFLEGEHDFDLIFKDEKIADFEIDSILTKEKDSTLTEVSEHISLEEKFENNLDYIIGYLDYKDIYNLMLVNKECFKTVINTMISKIEISIEVLMEEIKKIKENNPNLNFENISKKQFNFSSNSLRAISLLNSTSGNNILKLKSEEINKKEIILIYSLYFVATGKKSKILLLDDSKKIEFMQNYFKKNISKDNFGKFIEKELSHKIFDDKEIYFLYKLSKNHLDIISPNYFQKINKDIAIFVFVIKDILEQLGILNPIFIKPDIEFILLKAKLEVNRTILVELLQIEEQIY